MKKTGDLVSRLVEWIMAVLLAVMVVLVFGNAAGRYLFATGFAASEEISRLAFVWLIFLGAILAVRERAHVGVDMLIQRFGPVGKRISLGAMNLLILYALWLLREGQLATDDHRYGQRDPGHGRAARGIRGRGRHHRCLDGVSCLSSTSSGSSPAGSATTN